MVGVLVHEILRYLLQPYHSRFQRMFGLTPQPAVLSPHRSLSVGPSRIQRVSHQDNMEEWVGVQV